MALLTFEQYALVGNATFTLRSHRTGKHLTFTVRTNAYGNGHWVYGPNGEKCGRIEADGSYRIPKETDRVLDYAAAFRWCWNRRREANPRFDFLPSGKCCRCGRKLTTPESIADGIGPECRAALENGS